MTDRMPDLDTRITETRTIPLTQRKVAIVDAADFDLVGGFKWCVRREANGQSYRWYAERRLHLPEKGVVRLGHMVLGDPPAPGLFVDHKNGDGLDNRRCNLRWATPAQNSMNRHDKRGTSKYRGVSHRDGKWIATLNVARTRTNLGRFDTEDEAGRAWDAAATAAYGEFFVPNFPALAPEQTKGAA